MPGAKGVRTMSGRALKQRQERMPSFRFSLGKQKARVLPGGWAKEATATEFPSSKSIAGVLMHLERGGLRELHWHANAAEWAYVIDGHARTTIIDPNGRSETNDFSAGDIWYFPRGHGHSIQGLGPNGVTFLLVFDNGYFSEFATFSLADWLAHTPREVTAKNLHVSIRELDGLPEGELYITRGPAPDHSPSTPHQGTLLSPPQTHKYQLLAQKPTRKYEAGTLWLATAREFPISTTISGAVMELEPGGIRELHWHPNADEWQYVLDGQIRTTVFGSSGRAATVNLAKGDVGFAPMGYGHYLENTGKRRCRLVLAFNSGEYQEISVTAWLASNPQRLLETNLKLPGKVVRSFPPGHVFFTKGKGKSG